VSAAPTAAGAAGTALALTLSCSDGLGAVAPTATLPIVLTDAAPAAGSGADLAGACPAGFRPLG
jgi:hypothetical protein